MYCYTCQPVSVSIYIYNDNNVDDGCPVHSGYVFFKNPTFKTEFICVVCESICLIVILREQLKPSTMTTVFVSIFEYNFKRLEVRND